MDSKCGTAITLYASQAEPVWQAILSEGVAFSKASYVQQKYQESAPVFLTAYRWFVQQLSRYVPRPDGAEFPYWAFGDQYLMESGTSTHILTLQVPVEEAVFFDMRDWNRIVSLSYLGESEAEERRFMQDLKARGLTTRDVMLSGFYPDLKQEVLNSWQRLFRHHDAVCQGQDVRLHSLQAGLWCIRKEWVSRDNNIPIK